MQVQEVLNNWEMVIRGGYAVIVGYPPSGGRITTSPVEVMVEPDAERLVGWVKTKSGSLYALGEPKA